MPNPFATRYVRPGALPYRFGADRPDIDCLQELATTLQEFDGGSILGPHGTGKSTLLHGLHQHFEQQGITVIHFRLAGGDTKHRWRQQAGLWKDISQTLRIHRHLRPKRLLSELVVMIDGAEQLSPAIWYAIRQRCRLIGVPLIATAHRLVPGLTCRHRTNVKPNVLQEMTDVLLQQQTNWSESCRNKWIERWEWQRVSNARDQWSILYDAIAADSAIFTRPSPEPFACQPD